MAGVFQLLLTIVLTQLADVIHGQWFTTKIPCAIGGQTFKTDTQFNVVINGIYIRLHCSNRKQSSQYDCIGYCSRGDFSITCYTSPHVAWEPAFDNTVCTRKASSPEIPKRTATIPAGTVIAISLSVAFLVICTTCWTAKLKRRRESELQRRLRNNTRSMIFAATLPYGPGAALERSADTLSSSTNRSTVILDQPPPYTSNNEVVMSPPSYNDVIAAKQGTVADIDRPPPYTETIEFDCNNK